MRTKVRAAFFFLDRCETPGAAGAPGVSRLTGRPGSSVFYMKSGANSAIRATIVAHWMAVMALDMYFGTVFIVSSSK